MCRRGDGVGWASLSVVAAQSVAQSGPRGTLLRFTAARAAAAAALLALASAQAAPKPKPAMAGGAKRAAGSAGGGPSGAAASAGASALEVHELKLAVENEWAGGGTRARALALRQRVLQKVLGAVQQVGLDVPPPEPPFYACAAARCLRPWHRLCGPRPGPPK